MFVEGEGGPEEKGGTRGRGKCRDMSHQMEKEMTLCLVIGC